MAESHCRPEGDGTGSAIVREAKEVPSPKPDKGAIRQAGKARRAFPGAARAAAAIRRSAKKCDPPGGSPGTSGRRRAGAVGTRMGVRRSRLGRQRFRWGIARRRSAPQYRTASHHLVRPRGPLWGGWSAYGVVPKGDSFNAGRVDYVEGTRAEMYGTQVPLPYRYRPRGSPARPALLGLRPLLRRLLGV
jgi:hypothetical protein